MITGIPWTLMLLSGLFSLVSLWALYWLIRLAVRHGLNDAQRADPRPAPPTAREHERQ